VAAVLGDEGKAVGLASRRLCCLVPLRRAPMCEPPAVLVLRTVTFDVVGKRTCQYCGAVVGQPCAEAELDSF
jgi:hypothetical protein